MSLALTILGAWVTGFLTLGLFGLAGYLWWLDRDDDTSGVLIAAGALCAWAFLSVTGLTA